MVDSFVEYRNHIRTLLGRLPSEGVARFCLWCIDRFETAFGDRVWDGLIPDERNRLTEVIAELRERIEGGAPFPEARARSLQAELLGFGPHDEVAAIEVEVDATELMGAVWNTLEFLYSGDVESACAVSEALINCWDYRAEPRDEGYGLDTMFTFPELRAELTLQQAQIEQLQARHQQAQ